MMTLAMAAVGLVGMAAGMEAWGTLGNDTPPAVLRLAAAMLVAWPVARRLLRGVWYGGPDAASDVLVGLATGGALIGGEYLSAVFIPLVVELGHWLEERNQIGRDVAAAEFARLAQASATILEGDRERQVPADQLVVGQQLLVRPGERVLADGRVLQGRSCLDESRVTGESLPRDVEEGADIWAGTLNVLGMLRVEVTASGRTSSWGRVAGMLDEALDAKPPAVRRLERCAIWFLPGVAAACLATWIATQDRNQVLGVLVVSCPCALALAVPSAVVAAVLAAARDGVLIKSPRFIESLATARTVVFDKTGTLTEGEPSVSRTVLATGIREGECFAAAAHCALGSRHPLARAIAQHVRDDSTPRGPANAIYREEPGAGVVCRDEEALWRMGSWEWLAREGITLPARPEHSGPVVGVARNHDFLGGFLLSDTVRSEAREVLGGLRELGIHRFVLVSGDHPRSVESVGRELGIEVRFAEQRPADKFELVRAESRRGSGVIVVGDGINDALALAGGDVGVAVGSRGCAVAAGSADIVLGDNNLRSLLSGIRLARRVHRVIAQNLAISLIVVVWMLCWVWWGGLSPLGGAVAHHIGALLVLLNSARLAVSAPRRPRWLGGDWFRGLLPSGGRA